MNKWTDERIRKLVQMPQLSPTSPPAVYLYNYWTWPERPPHSTTHRFPQSTMEVSFSKSATLLSVSFSARPYYLMWLVMKSSAWQLRGGGEYICSYIPTPTADKINYFANVHVMGASFAMGLSACAVCTSSFVLRPSNWILCAPFPGWSALNCHKNALSTGIFWPTVVITGLFCALACHISTLNLYKFNCLPPSSSCFYLFICAASFDFFFLVHFFG